MPAYTSHTKILVHTYIDIYRQTEENMSVGKNKQPDRDRFSIKIT